MAPIYGKNEETLQTLKQKIITDSIHHLNHNIK